MLHVPLLVIVDPAFHNLLYGIILTIWMTYVGIFWLITFCTLTYQLHNLVLKPRPSLLPSLNHPHQVGFLSGLMNFLLTILVLDSSSLHKAIISLGLFSNPPLFLPQPFSIGVEPFRFSHLFMAHIFTLFLIGSLWWIEPHLPLALEHFSIGLTCVNFIIISLLLLLLIMTFLKHLSNVGTSCQHLYSHARSVRGLTHMLKSVREK